VSVALIASLALVAVPGSAGSRSPSPDQLIDTNLLREVQVASMAQERTMAAPTLDPAYRSDGALDAAQQLIDPAPGWSAPVRPGIVQPVAPTGIIVVPVWKYDPNVSFYGPGFYGRRTACGLAYTTTIMGVAHRTLPCGTKVSFRNPANGKTITVPVIDRGPYVAGRQWDLSGAACQALNHCYTGPIYWRFP
jgi:rare lipoprotein A (peptidoglycan hydrolase)